MFAQCCVVASVNVITTLESPCISYMSCKCGKVLKNVTYLHYVPYLQYFLLQSPPVLNYCKDDRSSILTYLKNVTFFKNSDQIMLHCDSIKQHLNHQLTQYL